MVTVLIIQTQLTITIIKRMVHTPMCLYAYNDEGCVDSASMDFVVNYRKGLFVPNAMYVGHAVLKLSAFHP